MKTLDEIGLETSSDKSSRFHDYLRRYEPLFAPFRDKPINLLEMGVLGGDSLVTWGRYFTHKRTHIIGIDIEDCRCQHIEDRRVQTQQLSQSDPEAFQVLYDAWLPIGQGWDIVIDDAGHFVSHQIAAFRNGWKWMFPGGLWIIEDLHCIHSPVHCDRGTILEFLTGILAEMQDRRGATGCAAYDPEDTWCDIESITFHKGFAVIRKRA